jgi:hypothetical protein
MGDVFHSVCTFHYTDIYEGQAVNTAVVVTYVINSQHRNKKNSQLRRIYNKDYNHSCIDKLTFIDNGTLEGKHRMENVAHNSSISTIRNNI